jgi:hypothetical protein
VFDNVQIRSAFRQNEHLTDAKEIQDAKQKAISALGNYHAVKAYEMAIEERDERSRELQQRARQHLKTRKNRS